MRVLLDTHTFIWAIEHPENLGVNASSTILDATNDLYISVASIWEMAIKMKIGKLVLEGGVNLGFFISEAILRLEIALLDIQCPHALIPETLPLHHSDPFDRLLVAQSLFENMPIISNDDKFDAYNIKRIW